MATKSNKEKKELDLILKQLKQNFNVDEKKTNRKTERQENKEEAKRK